MAVTADHAGDLDAAAAVAEALHVDYRTEIAKLKMQIVLYRAALVEAGIEPPDRAGDDLLELVRHSNAVIEAATDFVRFIGTSREVMFGFDALVQRDDGPTLR